MPPIDASCRRGSTIQQSTLGCITHLRALQSYSLRRSQEESMVHSNLHRKIKVTVKSRFPVSRARRVANEAITCGKVG